MNRGGPILVIDTATTRAVIALGMPDGAVTEARSWVAGYRHGEELLARIEALLRDRGIEPAALGAIVVGTGPGAFTGLRVGLATAKGLAHALGLPIVGIPTGSALLGAASGSHPSGVDPSGVDPSGVDRSGADGSDASGADGSGGLVLVQPAGPSDRVITRLGEAPRIVPGGTDLDVRQGERLVAVDLDGRAPDDAVELGRIAYDGLAAALLAEGAARLARGDADDLARLVPEYVTLPRGVRDRLPDEAVEVTGGAS